ncbi:MAG: hypothetical protein M1509_01375 [Nitrospirae bacterium]|nr:hypothetical protein [Nitrospirota bacterium]
MSEGGQGACPLLVVTALEDEARAFTHKLKGRVIPRSGRGVVAPSPVLPSRSPFEVVWVGPGKYGMGLLADLLSSGRYARVLFAGLAGALAPDLFPGTIVVAEGVLSSSGENFLPFQDFFPNFFRPMIEEWDKGSIRFGRILSAEALVGTPREKKRLARETGAIAVDMESAGWLDAASRAGIPATVVRVISDGADDSLPPELLSFVTPEGAVSFGGILRALLLRPALLYELLLLGSSIRQGRQALSRLGQEVFSALREEVR